MTAVPASAAQAAFPQNLVETTRPQRADARRNYEAVLAAARDAFAENGSDTSLEGIARRAGVGIGTLYRNFPTRLDLVLAVYVDEINGLARAADDVASLEPWDALTTWLDRFVEYAHTKRALLDGISRDSPMFQSCREVLYAAGTPLLQRAQASGDARDDIQMEDAFFMITGVIGVDFRTPEQRERVLGMAIDGLRAR